MKYIITLCIGAAINFVILHFVPLWWAFAPWAFIYLLIVPQATGWKHFWLGFLMLFIPWLLAYILKDIANAHVLSSKIAHMFSMPSGMYLFVIISGLMGLVSGLCANAAYFLRKK